LAVARQPRRWPVVCLADRMLLTARAQQLHLSMEFDDYRPGHPVTCAAGQLSVWHEPLAAQCVAGRLDPRNVQQVLRLIDRAVEGCVTGQFAAVVTAPVQKSLINEAGVVFTGHTEYIAARTRAALPVMMLVAGNLRVALATTHLPLRAVSAALNRERLTQILAILWQDLRRYFGLAAPRIAVCGLNPHAGEGGHLGDEEITIIAPAIKHARASGIVADGPLPADTVFVPRHLAHYDAVLAMYHDQGLPVLKHAGFGSAVNVTLGLPIVRTSPDHGTAFDIAGKFLARPDSLIAAIRLAAEIAERRAAAVAA
jgi:4-hydroxythreonine-4-phosphate dehydrogenase